MKKSFSFKKGKSVEILELGKSVTPFPMILRKNVKWKISPKGSTISFIVELVRSNDTKLDIVNPIMKIMSLPLRSLMVEDSTNNDISLIIGSSFKEVIVIKTVEVVYVEFVDEYNYPLSAYLKIEAILV